MFTNIGENLLIRIVVRISSTVPNMAIVTALCVSILLLCNHLVDCRNGDDSGKPDWKTAMMKKLEELQNVVNTQAGQISSLELRNVRNAQELNSLQNTVNTQRKRISVLEKRQLDLKTIATSQAKELKSQTDLGNEKSLQISAFQKRQEIFEKRSRMMESRLTKLMKILKKNDEIMKTFHSGINFKKQRGSLIRKGMNYYLFPFSFSFTYYANPMRYFNQLHSSEKYF
jgi:hypothetical protein